MCKNSTKYDHYTENYLTKRVTKLLQKIDHFA